MGRFLVNYRGPGGTFPHISLADLAEGQTAPDAFKDKVVLVGPTAVGIFDLRVTPFDSVYPGVEVHATVIDNVLQQDFLVRPDWVPLLNAAAIIVAGPYPGPGHAQAFGQHQPHPGPGAHRRVQRRQLCALCRPDNQERHLGGPGSRRVVTVVLVYTGVTIYRYMTEERGKTEDQGRVHVVRPTRPLVNEMLKNPDLLKLGGAKRVATVLFSDIRGFTTISEKLDPEELVTLLNKYLTRMTDLVMDNDGLLDKYIGDAVMAIWGAPLTNPKHAALSCRTALQMMADLVDLRRELQEEDPEVPYLDIGIGLKQRADGRGQHGFGIAHGLHGHGRLGQPGFAAGRSQQAVRHSISSSAR